MEQKDIKSCGEVRGGYFARNIISTRGLIMKRALDILGGLVGMLILAVATIFVARLSSWSHGTVFFGQTESERMDAAYFYKFRSMYQDGSSVRKS